MAEKTNRVQQTEDKLQELFGGVTGGMMDTDPEFMAILQRQIFGDIFHTADLDDRAREIITIVALATLQTLPQLEAHIHAALNIDVSPVTIRETIYQTAPFIGYPKTLNAIATMNKVFESHEIALPLPSSATTTEDDRFEKGRELQESLYGTEIKDAFASLPAPFNEAIAYHLSATGFGDFETRKDLSVAQRELLIVVILTAHGDVANQLVPHFHGAVKAGNSPEKILAALLQAYPYVGFPRFINAVRIFRETGLLD